MTFSSLKNMMAGKSAKMALVHTNKVRSPHATAVKHHKRLDKQVNANTDAGHLSDAALSRTVKFTPPEPSRDVLSHSQARPQLSALSCDGNFSAMFSASASPKNSNKQSVLLARQDFYFRDRPSDSNCPTLLVNSTELRQAARYRLSMTASGEPVTTEEVHQLMSVELLEATRNNATGVSAEVRTISVPPFSCLDLVVPGLYLTGWFAMLKRNIRSQQITLIINATNELPLYKDKSGQVSSLRVPVADESEHEPIHLYFDDVSDLIEANRRAGYNSVVHCMAGVSRSTTLVLAYLLKYTSLSLHQAFMHCKAIRPCIRPNMGFFQQLIQYECTLNGQASTRMVQVQDSATARKATVPHFYQDQCPDLFAIELDRQSKRAGR